MRLLLIHSDFIEYEAKKKTGMAEECLVLKDSQEEALTVFCAVEAVDEDDLDGVVEQAAFEIKKTAEQLSVSNIVIYPYAHLSSDLARPDAAIDALRMLEDRMKEADFNVKRAPFGWYKAFRLSCKGHPLSELSKTIVPSEEGAKKEKKVVEHEFFVMTPDGARHEVGDYMDDSPFGCLVRKELGEATPTGGEPVHVDLMRSKELVDYEPASDVGHLRWLPRGKLIRDLLADYVLTLVLPYGATPVETPVMYDLGDRAIFEHADKFGERQYRFKSGNRNMMLRFAACFGMFSIMRDMHISPNTLPMKMYELSTYSFRHEQKGEVIGLKRLRAFTMPDMHSLCTDMPEALKCFEEQLDMGWRTGRDFGTHLVGVFRCTRDFYEQYEDWVKRSWQTQAFPCSSRYSRTVCITGLPRLTLPPSTGRAGLLRTRPSRSTWKARLGSTSGTIRTAKKCTRQSSTVRRPAAWNGLSVPFLRTPHTRRSHGSRHGSHRHRCVSSRWRNVISGMQPCSPIA